MSAAASSVAQQGFRPGGGRGRMGAPVEKPKAPAPKPAPATVEEEFNLDDILAEFK